MPIIMSEIMQVIKLDTKNIITWFPNTKAGNENDPRKRIHCNQDSQININTIQAGNKQTINLMNPSQLITENSGFVCNLLPSRYF